jgi:hypothetical protein
MIRQVTFSGAAIVAVVLAIYLDLTFVGVAILFGSAFAILSYVFEVERSGSSATGYFMVFLGMGLLAVAYVVCNRYGISFETLDQDRSFPKLVRRLPYFGIACISFGATSLAMWFFAGRGPNS